MVNERGPLSVECPNCQSPAWAPCTAPTDNGRRPLRAFHIAREHAAVVAVPPPTLAQTLAETLLAVLVDDPTVMYIACECGRDVEMFSEITAAPILELIEHAAFDHPTRRSVHVYRAQELVSGDDLGILLRLAPVTEAEHKRREARAQDLR